MHNVFGLGDQDYSNIIIEGIKFIVVITMKIPTSLRYGRPQITAIGTDIHRYGSRRKVLVGPVMKIENRGCVQ